MFTSNRYDTPIDSSTTAVAMESERLSVPVAAMAAEEIFLPMLRLYANI